MHVVIFEGSQWKSFAPLSLSRPVFTLLSGMSTLLDKQLRHLRPTRLTLWTRPELEEHCRVRILPGLRIPTAVNTPLDDEPALLVSGRLLMMSGLEAPGEPAVMLDEGNLVRMAYARMPGLGPEDVMTRSPRWLELLDLPHMMPQGRLVETVWDLIGWNEESLIGDSLQLKGTPRATAPGFVNCVNPNDCWIHPAARVSPGVVLDASKGPVILAEQTQIGANSVLEGPCYIGPHSVIRPLTLVRSGVSLGTLCKVGGEIADAILLGYSNKSHDGFLGHSYLGKWVNVGAGTITSNLKNTYGEISIQLGNRQIPTGRRFLGALIGDHAKIAIGTRLITGTYIGFCSQLSGGGFPPKFIPSFSFWTDKGLEKYRMEQAIDVTTRVFARRDRRWTDYDLRIMQYVDATAPTIEV